MVDSLWAKDLASAFFTMAELNVTGACSAGAFVVVAAAVVVVIVLVLVLVLGFWCALFLVSLLYIVLFCFISPYFDCSFPLTLGTGSGPGCDLLDGFLEHFVMPNGDVIAWPGSGVLGFLYYRKDLFDKHPEIPAPPYDSYYDLEVCPLREHVEYLILGIDRRGTDARRRAE